MSKVKVTKIAYGGWQNCLQLSNGIADCVITTDVGPRILRFGFVGQQNEFYEIEEDLGKAGGNEYRFYGGHRMWHGPQVEPRCCLPDNSPVQFQIDGSTVKLTQEIEKESGIQKQMEVTMAEDSAELRLLHRMSNKGQWAVELAVWPLTMMRRGGTEYIPLNTRNTGLLPNKNIIFWPWTRPDDYRIKWGRKFVTLRQDKNAEEVGPNYENAVKFGLNCEDGFAAYFNDAHLFTKHFSPKEDCIYPDWGCSYETYTNKYMLEMESLSPLTKLAPGEAAEHTEIWRLYDNLHEPSSEEEAQRLFAGLKK